MFRKIGSYFLNVLLAIDQLGNTIIGGAPDETISARAGRNDGKNPLASATCNVLDAIDDGHCADAVQSERTHAHHPEAYKHSPDKAA